MSAITLKRYALKNGALIDTPRFRQAQRNALAAFESIRFVGRDHDLSIYGIYYIPKSSELTRS